MIIGSDTKVNLVPELFNKAKAKKKVTREIIYYESLWYFQINGGYIYA